MSLSIHLHRVYDGCVVNQDGEGCMRIVGINQKTVIMLMIVAVVEGEKRDAKANLQDIR